MWKKKTPGGFLFQWIEKSLDFSIMAIILWILVCLLLNLIFSNPKKSFFVEIGWEKNWRKELILGMRKLSSGNCFSSIFFPQPPFNRTFLIIYIFISLTLPCEVGWLYLLFFLNFQPHHHHRHQQLHHLHPHLHLDFFFTGLLHSLASASPMVLPVNNNHNNKNK